MKFLNFYIVEDEPLITATIVLVLKKYGYSVLGHSDEHDSALIEIVKLKPDIILLDIRLEGNKDGIALALKLDQLDIKYIYLSSLADPITSEQVKKTNPLGFIDKPFTEVGLINHIASMANSRKYKSHNPNLCLFELFNLRNQ